MIESHIEIARDVAAGADREPARSMATRRAVTVPATVVMLVLAIASAPLWIPLAAAVDLAFGGRRCSLRCGAFLVYYLACEMVGILASFGIWIAAVLRGRPLDSSEYFEHNFALQRAWSGWLLGGAARIFGFRIEASGLDALEAGPMLLLLRHASVADTLLASEFVSRRHGVHLRYVIKRELLWDPCLDIVGNRLPNYFVRRGTGDTDREVRGIQSLVAGLRPDEGVLLYPEGTRFTPAKRDRILQRLRAGGHSDLARRSEHLRNTLPPRPAGLLGLLEVNPGLDAVFCAHTGFEATASFWDLWNGSLHDAVIHTRFWRVPFEEIPQEPAARLDWIFDHWQQIDDWIEATRAGL